MQTVLSLFIASVFSLGLSCAVPHPDRKKAKQLFGEIEEIAQRPVGGQHSDQIMQAMMRLNEAKKNFPGDRGKMMADARLGKEFFTSGIEGHQQIIGKLEELLTLRLATSNAVCVEISIKVQRAQIEQMQNTLSQLELFFDESIMSKETLDLRSFQMREDAKLLETKVKELEAEQGELCSKSRLEGE
jgi:hypothetical protein